MQKLTTIGQHFNQIFSDFGYKVDVNGGPINPQIKGQPDIDLSGREYDLAMREAEAQQNDLAIQAENEWINQQDRIFDATY